MRQLLLSRAPPIWITSSPDAILPPSIETTTPSVESAPTGLTTKRRPCDLPEDVFREICLYLSDWERLKFSLSSKAFYAAFPPRPTNFVCSRISHAASLSRYLASKAGNAGHLASLSINFHRPRDVHKASDYLRKILSAARNLRHLTCGDGALDNALIRRVIEALPSLLHLTVYRPKRAALTTTLYPQYLVSLHIIYGGGEFDWSDLAGLLSHLPNVTELELVDSNFSYPDASSEGFDAESGTFKPPISHPTLRRLVVSSTPDSTDPRGYTWRTSFPSLWYIGRQFPNLNTLVLDGTPLPIDEGYEPRYIVGWNGAHALTRLTVRADSLTPSLWTAHVVELEFTSQLRWFEYEGIEQDFSSTAISLSDILFEHAFFELKTLPLMFLCIAAPYTHDPSISDDAEQELCNRLLEHAVVALPSRRYLALGKVPKVRPSIRTRWRWWRVLRETECIDER